MKPKHSCDPKQLDDFINVESSFPTLSDVISRDMMDVFVRELLIDAKKMYDANVCTMYHTWDHVLDVFSSYVKAFGGASPEVEAAIAFHDVVYIPTSSNGANELLSAKYLEACARRKEAYFPSQFKCFDLNLATRIIERTTIADHLKMRKTSHERFLPEIALEVSKVCDADLSSLALPWAKFVCNQENIIIEQTGIKREEITADHRYKSARFLSLFLKLDSIYYNESAKKLWEDRAWYNIIRWMRENNVRDDQ